MRCIMPVAFVLLCAVAPATAQEPCAGETLISPLDSNNSYLIDIDLNVIRTWHCTSFPGINAYLLEDGSILRPCTSPGGPFYGGEFGGRIQRYDADDQLIWDYDFSTDDHAQHHDVELMPNGNVLLIAWERKTREEAVAAGRVDLHDEIWPTMIAEVEPVGATGGNVIWEWHLWDHLIQDVDPTRENYGVVGDHPELLDINLEYVSIGDWVHANAIGYNPELDQITFSSYFMDEIYVIDHSTTTAEATGHTGGSSGMGGDLLYRWGNPQNYRAGNADDQILFVVHGVHWIDPGLPGEGNLLVFNNGDRPGNSSDYSSVEELVPPLDGYNYQRAAGQPFGPEAPIWIYSDPDSFYSSHYSGAYRMPNGNTLITEGIGGHVFEVTGSGVPVWDYDIFGNLSRSPRYNMEATAVSELATSPAPASSRLLDNYPDPFNPSTHIPFELDQPGRVHIAVFDLNGRLVQELIDAVLEVGRHEVEWNGRGTRGQSAASGTYLVRLQVNEFVEAERLVLLR